MAKFSEHFGLNKSQYELDFIDVRLDRDMRLYVDPFAISMRQDRWGLQAHAILTTYFQSVVDRIRDGRGDEARALLSYLSEPNETRLGQSKGKPQGAGIGPEQADDLYAALAKSQAVKTGFLSSLQDCELMIRGIGRDKISDLATNVLRGHFALYTRGQCDLHGVPTRPVSIGPHFDMNRREWQSDYFELPVVGDKPVLLVSKTIARYDPAYNHQKYYKGFALEYLRAEQLRAGGALVRTFKNKRRTVFKKDLEALYPCTKEFLFEFSRDNPMVLSHYKKKLAALEAKKLSKPISPEDEVDIAAALKAALKSIMPGNNGASAYHRLMIGVMEFVFFPNLVGPRKEQEIDEGRKRIDIVMENAATSGIFHRLHDVKKLPCAYIVFECKNYSTDIANPELDQIGGRFHTNRGKAGFICCRSFDDRALFVKRCRDTLKADRGLIVAIDDAAVIRWLDLIAARERSEVEIDVAALIEEVWLA